jgi:hypothetical protein
MHVYSNISIHSIQNPNYICFFKKNLEEKKKSDTRLTYGHMPKLHVAIRPRTLEHVATWPRVNNLRGHVATCNKYTCPNGHMYKYTWPRL